MQKPISTVKILLTTWALCLCGSLGSTTVLWLMRMFIEMEFIAFSEGLRAISMVLFTVTALASIPIVAEHKKELGKRYGELFANCGQFFKGN